MHFDNHIFWSKNTLKAYVIDGAEGNANKKANFWGMAKSLFFDGKEVDTKNIEKEYKTD